VSISDRAIFHGIVVEMASKSLRMFGKLKTFCWKRSGLSFEFESTLDLRFQEDARGQLINRRIVPWAHMSAAYEEN
jgi:hypothetical protein